MNYAQAYEQFHALFENKLTEDEARALLIELYEQGENDEEIAAAAKVMREHSVKFYRYQKQKRYQKQNKMTT